MKLDCIGKLLCEFGHHDFELVARWCATDGSAVLKEEHCTRCGEDAYSLDMFNPSACSILKRCLIKKGALATTCLIEGVGLDRRICESGREEALTKKRKRTRNKVEIPAQEA